MIGRIRTFDPNLGKVVLYDKNLGCDNSTPMTEMEREADRSVRRLERPLSILVFPKGAVPESPTKRTLEWRARSGENVGAECPE